jgi:type IV pilus assembly protein PilA
MASDQKGFSLIELLVVVVIIMVIAAIAIPSLIHAKQRGNETSAVGSLHAINTACANYAQTYGTGFPAQLVNLGPAPVADANRADLLDAVLVGGTKSGYTFTYTAGTPNGGIIDTYQVVAEPSSRGTSGVTGYYTDQSLVLHANPTGPADVSSPPIQ